MMSEWKINSIVLSKITYWNFWQIACQQVMFFIQDIFPYLKHSKYIFLFLLSHSYWYLILKRSQLLYHHFHISISSSMSNESK